VHLLIVDDERGISTFIGFIARDRGWSAASAASAEELRKCFSERRPDAIVLDLQLGDDDGMEQLGFLAENAFRGSLIIISGFDRRVLGAAERRAASLGLDIIGAESKPLRGRRLQELLEMIETEIGRRLIETVPDFAKPQRAGNG
jgi:DNA-binding response OmpR family regulator